MTIAEFNLAASATAIAEDIEARMEAQLRLVAAANLTDQISLVLSGEHRVTIPSNIPDGLRGELHGYIINLAHRRLWQRSRMVYAVHPDMQSELADCSSTTLPTWVFKLLPHTDPLIIFAEPVPVTTPAGEPARVLGFAVSGRTNDTKAVCSTHDEDVDGLGLMFLIAIHNEHGARLATEVTRCTIPLSEERFTVADAVEKTLSRFALGPDAMLRRDKLKLWLEELLCTAINTLLYLCTEDADVAEAPKPRKPVKKKGKSKERQPKPTRLIKVGWWLGPALAKARKAVAAQPWRPGVAGQRQPPHQRRCHFRDQHYGPGRKQLKLLFIKPYWVSLDLLDSVGLRNTVVPVVPNAKRNKPTAKTNSRPDKAVSRPGTR